MDTYTPLGSITIILPSATFYLSGHATFPVLNPEISDASTVISSSPSASPAGVPEAIIHTNDWRINPDLVPILLAAIVLLAIVCLGLSCFIFFKLRKRRKRSTYKEKRPRHKLSYSISDSGSTRIPSVLSRDGQLIVTSDSVYAQSTHTSSTDRNAWADGREAPQAPQRDSVSTQTAPPQYLLQTSSVESLHDPFNPSLQDPFNPSSHSLLP